MYQMYISEHFIINSYYLSGHFNTCAYLLFLVIYTWELVLLFLQILNVNRGMRRCEESPVEVKVSKSAGWMSSLWRSSRLFSDFTWPKLPGPTRLSPSYSLEWEIASSKLWGPKCTAQRIRKIHVIDSHTFLPLNVKRNVKCMSTCWSAYWNPWVCFLYSRIKVLIVCRKYRIIVILCWIIRYVYLIINK